MVNLQTVGFDVLNEKDKRDFQKLFVEYSKKIQYKIKDIELIKIHLKEYNYREDIADKNKKFSIHVEVRGPMKSIEANAFDWDFKRALHKVFKKMIEEAEHTLHSSNQNKP